MKTETQIHIARITAGVLFYIPFVVVLVGSIGALLSTFPMLPQPNFLHRISVAFCIGFFAGCLPLLILLYGFASALSETKFRKGLVFFLLYYGLQMGAGVFFVAFFEVGFSWRSWWWLWLVNIVVFLLLFQGVIGLYKSEKREKTRTISRQFKAKKTKTAVKSFRLFPRPKTKNTRSSSPTWKSGR